MPSEQSSESAPQPASMRGGNYGTGDHTALLVSAQAAAKMLAIAPRTLWQYTRWNAIPCVRVGRRVLYRPSELEAWLDAGAPTEPGAADEVRAAIEGCREKRGVRG